MFQSLFGSLLGSQSNLQAIKENEENKETFSFILKMVKHPSKSQTIQNVTGSTTVQKLLQKFNTFKDYYNKLNKQDQQKVILIIGTKSYYYFFIKNQTLSSAKQKGMGLISFQEKPRATNSIQISEKSFGGILSFDLFIQE